MTEEEFFHKRHISILSNHLLENNWVWLYKKESLLSESPSVFSKYWCYLAEPNKAISSLNNYTQDIDENSPYSLSFDYVYTPYQKIGFRHITTIRSFKLKGTWVNQIRLCDELIYFHNLYECHENELIRYYTTDGSETLVCEIGKTYAKILNRYLIEFIAAMKMDLVCVVQSEIEYDMNNYNPSFKYNATDEKGISLSNSPNQNFNLMINPCFSTMRNWFNGKVVYAHKSLKQLIEAKVSQIQYIIGEDEDGCPILSDNNSNPYCKVFFNKELLNLYKHSARGCAIKPLSISTPTFYIRCDNDLDSHIIVFLKDLWDLPIKDQKKWVAYNIPPVDSDFSDIFKRSIIQGNWLGESKSADFVFRDTYKSLLSKWNSRFGWLPFKPLNSYQGELIQSMTILPQNSPKELSELLQIICLLFQDSLNIDSFPIKQLERETKINFLQRMLESLGLNDNSLKDFLLNIQLLRSKISTAHHLSAKIDNKTKSSYDYFGLKQDLSNTTDTSIQIFKIGTEAMKGVIDFL